MNVVSSFVIISLGEKEREREREREIACLFHLTVSVPRSLSYGAVGWSALFDCGSSWFRQTMNFLYLKEMDIDL